MTARDRSIHRINHTPMDEIVIDTNSDWRVGDLETVEDCAAAFTELTATIIGIEAQLAEAEEDEYAPDPRWWARVNGALRWKKAALNAVQTRRGAIQREERRIQQETRDRLLLDEIRLGLSPVEFMEYVRRAAERRPDVFGEFNADHWALKALKLQEQPPDIRTVKEEVTIDGIHIRPGDRVLLNLDPKPPKKVVQRVRLITPLDDD